MRAVTSYLAAAAISALAFLGAAAPASASITWTFPNGTSFTLADAFDASKTATVTVMNLSITEGGPTTGYVRVETKVPRSYVCTTSSFSGSAAQFSPGSFEPCTGSVSFSVDPSTGALSASASLVVASLVFSGPATGGATGTRLAPVVVPLQNCTASYDATGKLVDVDFDANADATSYDATVSGSGDLSLPGVGDASKTSFRVPIDVVKLKPLTAGSDLSFTVEIIGKRSDGATVATCTSPAVTVPGLRPPVITTTVPVSAGGLLTVNYDVAGSPVLQGVEYRLGTGPWLRPGGAAPVSGVGGSFTISGIKEKSVDLTLRSVSTVATGEVTATGKTLPIAFPAMPSSTPAAAAVAPAAKPTSSVAGTSNGVGTGTNGALAATTGDAGIDAPCSAKNGTLYPTMYSTVGSQLTMAPNTSGMGEPAAFTVVAGALPPGMQLDGIIGVIFGVPTQAGSWSTTVRARFEDGSTRDGKFATRVDADAQSLQYAPLTLGYVGSTVLIAPSTNAPATETTYKLVCGQLPKGTALDARTGQITGTPVAEISEPVPVRIAETSATGAAAASFLFVVTKAGAPQMNYPAHPHVRVGKRVTLRPSIVNVDDIKEYRTSIGKLPRGLRLNHRTGDITGRVLRPGKAHKVTIVAETTGGALLTSTPMRITMTRAR